MQIKELLDELDEITKPNKSLGVLLKDGSCHFFDNELEADQFVAEHKEQVKRYVSLQIHSYDDYLNGKFEL